SREIWLDVLARTGIWHERTGSLHLAYSADEAAVLDEFSRDAAAQGFSCEMLVPAQALARSARVRAAGLVAAMWSPNEVMVDPRVALESLPDWRRRWLGVTFVFDADVAICDPPRLHAGARAWTAERIWICAGDNLRTLYPEQFECAGLVRCK